MTSPLGFYCLSVEQFHFVTAQALSANIPSSDKGKGLKSVWESLKIASFYVHRSLDSSLYACSFHHESIISLKKGRLQCYGRMNVVASRHLATPPQRARVLRKSIKDRMSWRSADRSADITDSWLSPYQPSKTTVSTLQ